MALYDEYSQSVKQVKADSYPVSIGEIANMYKDGDLVISPEYQRYYRWKLKNKSDFIESLLLGIPIPSLFVSQDKTGTWNVIDGLQRISSVLEFMGILRKPNTDNDLYSGIELEPTKFLPSLGGKSWNGKSNIGEELRRIFKRRKMTFIIVDETDNAAIKYELFQRLNTNGLVLKPQEIRNVSLLMASHEVFDMINDMCADNHYQNIYSISSDRKAAQEDKDAVSAYVVMATLRDYKIDSSADIGNFLTDRLVEVSPTLTGEDRNLIESRFFESVQLLDDVFGENAFKKWDSSKKKYKGASLRAMLEVLLPLVSNHLSWFTDHQEQLEQIQKSLPSDERYKKDTKAGTRAINRMSRLRKLSENIANESKKS
ncbi:DUF262 domain-containing protein [Lacticaseibacillus paracasei]|uniref:DUF262 domain-containing protein n=1 Tax=Lacticaseibacillus paracasei TaxID=1597 RepID=UPI001158C529|nr:DUF262 domain-containing protein [Lacticaseibacillus paracasei]MCT3351707.1 DUF262 domain-containing protein [Lacticaseibacillus paracasei]VTZ84790.1 hypothetical protein LPCP272_02808 [Lacticaseibacillus paracasei]